MQDQNEREAARPRVLVVAGTRPEAIKLVPVITALRERGDELRTRIAATGQHAELLSQVWEPLGIRPDVDLKVMEPGGSLARLSVNVLSAADELLRREQPAMVLVQGDTTTVAMVALAAFYLGIPVGHVEAGLRTHDIRAPFPEEVNRCLADRVSDLHFAPTEHARDKLLAEGIRPEHVHVTGNTIVDALLAMLPIVRQASMRELGLADLWDARKRLVVLTTHRRESLGARMLAVLGAVGALARRFEDTVEVVFPVHPNPEVRKALEPLKGLPNVHIIEPLPYASFVRLMSEAWLIMTDSGGIQEEAPTLRVPALVLRDTTERPEVIETGWVRLTGTDPARIEAEAVPFLTRATRDAVPMATDGNPCGDGHAGERIAQIVSEFLAGGAGPCQ